jgi:hypothetical protein
MMMTLKKIVLIVLLVLGNGAILYCQNDYTITRLSFNTSSKELAPAFYLNGLVFCSDRRSEAFIKYTDQGGNLMTHLYQTIQKKPGKFENPHLFSKELTTLMFEGPSTFSRDGKTIYFTRTINASGKQSRSDSTFGIFSAQMINGVWTNITPFPFNSPAYNTGYPYVSDDGGRLFFCSDAPGGSGGFDIYVSEKKNGRWSDPVNLGPQVNTSKNEVFPLLHASGRLYFSSRGYNQKGDLDIYYTVQVDGAWQKPTRLREPFNSDADDFGMIWNEASDTGYFVTNRDGSQDIYAAYSIMPQFTNCPEQVEDDYCYAFYESHNNEIDTTAFAYQWKFSDGTVVRTLRAEHCFANPGTYTVELNIIDKLTGEVLLNQATYNQVVERTEQPYVQVSDTVFTGEAVRFEGGQTYIKNFTASNYYWDFNDGTRSSGVTTQHTYNHPGIYNIVLGLTGKTNEETENENKHCVTRHIVVLKRKP